MGGCFVPGCKRRAKGENHHLFRPPSGVAKEWTIIMNKYRSDKKFDPANQNHRVCSDHFESQFLIVCDKFTIQGKTVELARDNWTLTRDAVPTLFKCLPEHMQPKLTKERRKLVRISPITSCKSKDKSNIGEKEILFDSGAPDDIDMSLPDCIDISKAFSREIVESWWAKKKEAHQEWLYKSSSDRTSIFTLGIQDGRPIIEKSIMVGISQFNTIANVFHKKLHFILQVFVTFI